MRRLITVAIAAACLTVFAPSAFAAPPTLVGDDYLVQPGQTITFSDVTLNSCHALQGGVNIQGDTVVVQSFGNNTGSECVPLNLGSHSITNDTNADLTLRLWLQDNSCSIIYFADGSHAKIGKNRAALNDGGDGCENLFDRSMPKGKSANMTVSVSIE
jgi:hypothetical protein